MASVGYAGSGRDATSIDQLVRSIPFFDVSTYFNYLKKNEDMGWKICIVGTSTVGKTFLLMRILEQSKIKFDYIYVSSNTYKQTVYERLTFPSNCFVYTKSSAKRLQEKSLNELANNDRAAALDLECFELNQDDGAAVAGSGGSVANARKKAAGWDNYGQKPFKTLYILDDVPTSAYHRNTAFQEFVRNARHRNIYIALIIHDIRNLDTGMRSEFDVFNLNEAPFFSNVLCNNMSVPAGSIIKKLVNIVKQMQDENDCKPTHVKPADTKCYLMLITKERDANLYRIRHDDNARQFIESCTQARFHTKAGYAYHKCLQAKSQQRALQHQQNRRPIDAALSAAAAKTIPRPLPGDIIFNN